MSMIKIVNVETGEEIEREMTASELKEAEKLAEKWEKEEAERIILEQNKNDLLLRLNLTEDEAKLLLS